MKPDVLQLGDLVRLDGLAKPSVPDGKFLATLSSLPIDSCNQLVSKIEGSEEIVTDDIKDLTALTREALTSMKVDYFGDQLEFDKYRSIEDLKANTEACLQVERFEEIVKYGSIRYLPVSIAKKIGQRNDPAGEEIHFHELEEISVDAVRVLAEYTEDIYFHKLGRIDLPMAKAFVKTYAKTLSFLSVRELDADVAKILAGYFGNLDLDGLKVLDQKVAKQLAKKKAHLRLGLAKIELAAAKELANFQGERLSLFHLEELSPEVAEQLAKIKGELIIRTTPEISKELAEVLGGHEGGLELYNLNRINIDVARGLAFQKGYLNIRGVTELSAEAAEALCSLHQGKIDLGLIHLDEKVAKYLRRNIGDIVLRSVRTFTDEAARMLANRLFKVRVDHVELQKKIEEYRGESIPQK